LFSGILRGRTRKKLQSLGINLDVVYIKRNKSRRSILSLFTQTIPVLRFIFLREPTMVAKNYNLRMGRLVKKVKRSFNPDIVQIEYNNMYHYAKHFNQKNTILQEHDVTTILKRRLYETNTKWLDRQLNYLEYRKWNSIEPKILRKFHQVVTLTEEDLHFTKRWINIPEIRVIPPAVYTDIASPVTKEKNCLVFVGSLNRITNIQALELIIQEIYPNVKVHHKNAKLKIAGKYLPNHLARYIKNYPNIEYHGFVDDIDTFIASSSLFISPIISGAGLKMKTTHALACGTPVLTTSIGAEGISISEDDGLFVEDDIVKMTDKCNQLLMDHNLDQYGRRGKSRVEKLYSIKVIREKWINLYNEISKN